MQNNKILYKSISEEFNCYIGLADELSWFIKTHTGISIDALSKDQESMVLKNFHKMSADKRRIKLASFERYIIHCHELVARGMSLRDKKESLNAFLYKYMLTVPDIEDILKIIDKDTFIEIYDNHFTQVYRSADFFEVTNHSILALEVCEWFELFERSKDLTADQLEVVNKIFSGDITVPVYKPIEDHSVKEINSKHPRNSQAEIVLYSPIFGVDNTFHGILHVFKVIESKSLEFKVV